MPRRRGLAGSPPRRKPPRLRPSPWFLRETTRVTRMNASRRSSSRPHPLRSLARNPGDATSRWRLAYTSSVPSDVASLRLRYFGVLARASRPPKRFTVFANLARERGVFVQQISCVPLVRDLRLGGRRRHASRDGKRRIAHRGRRGDGDGIRHDDVCAGKCVAARPRSRRIRSWFGANGWLEISFPPNAILLVSSPCRHRKDDIADFSVVMSNTRRDAHRLSSHGGLARGFGGVLHPGDGGAR